MAYDTIANISLDLYNDNFVIVNAKQGDSESRYVEVTVTEYGVPYFVDKKTVLAYVRCCKPDGKYSFNLGNITDDGKIIIKLTEQILAVEGRGIIDLTLTSVFTEESIEIDTDSDVVIIDDGKGNAILDIQNTIEEEIDVENKTRLAILSTMSFYLNICKNPVENIDITSEPEYGALNDLLKKVAETEKNYAENVGFLMDKCDELEETKLNIKFPTLSNEQKVQMQALIDQYLRVRNTLFCYAGGSRREIYAYTGSGTSKPISHTLTNYPVLAHADSSVDSKNPDTIYYKYMLNCGLFCQMIWMGRPVSDFLTGTTDAETLLLSYAEGDTNSPKKAALTACPTVTTEINSVFKDSLNNYWGYYFDFLLSKKSFGVLHQSGRLYNANSYFIYDDSPVEITIQPVTTTKYTCDLRYGAASGYPLINQVFINGQFVITVEENQTISAGTDILLGTIPSQKDIHDDERWYRPVRRTAMAVHQSSKIFTGYVNSSGEVYARCNEDLTENTYNIAVNTMYVPKDKISPNGSTVAEGFDGCASMAEELYIMGCEVPYSQIDIGDLVFYRSQDIGDDFRNELSDEDDDARINKKFRYISHVGVVYDIKDGHPVTVDCTTGWTDPNVLGSSTIATNKIYQSVKACDERNRTVMVARHPAAFGKGGNVPSNFNVYRGTLAGEVYS